MRKAAFEAAAPDEKEARPAQAGGPQENETTPTPYAVSESSSTVWDSAIAFRKCQLFRWYDALFSPRRNAIDHAVGYYLSQKINWKTGRWKEEIHQSEVAADFGMSRQTINTALSRLEEDGLIGRSGRRGQGLPVRYQLRLPTRERREV